MYFYIFLSTQYTEYWKHERNSNPLTYSKNQVYFPRLLMILIDRII